ncbi:unnamed protein product [Adineta ricciae]|uniref:C2H2-type domain-containing protein n=1 Tax=Adineta ricciae TaxID=249248 RepID=A0A813W9J6_ADIRI|nr:unnamed protein product [Adineta ricciae]CAF0926733.1 unnamed protein product [Adineta ricciae]
MALNVHLQMYHKQIGIPTTFNKYSSHMGHYHCPVKTCTFHCCYGNCQFAQSASSSFSSFNAHYLRQHGAKKQQCSKCLKSFGLHQDLIAHERICGIQCPFSCSNCQQQFHNRTSLRRHQLKYHTDSYDAPTTTKLPPLSKQKEPRKRPNRRRPLPAHQIELPLPSTAHSSVIINPHALALLKNFNSESQFVSPGTNPPISINKSTQTNTYVSIGTECCSFSSPTQTIEQKSSQTTNSVRLPKNRTRYSSSISSVSQWKPIHVIDKETQMSSPIRCDMCIQTMNPISNLPSHSSEPDSHVITQTIPIPTTSTEMQTMNDYSLEHTTNLSSTCPLFPEQESNGTSCLLDDFLLNGLPSSVLSDMNTMDLLDLIDNSTQTYSSIANHQTQTIADWDNMLITEDEYIQMIIKS